MLKKICKIVTLVAAVGVLSVPAWSVDNTQIMSIEKPLIIAHGGNGPGDGTGNDGDGPADGTGNGPGVC